MRSCFQLKVSAFLLVKRGKKKLVSFKIVKLNCKNIGNFETLALFVTNMFFISLSI